MPEFPDLICNIQNEEQRKRERIKQKQLWKEINDKCQQENIKDLHFIGILMEDINVAQDEKKGPILGRIIRTLEHPNTQMDGKALQKAKY